MGKLLLTTRAKNDLKTLPRLIQEAVLETLTALEGDPERSGKELKGRLRGLWSCRVGNYRILYTIETKTRKKTVIVRAIRHRATAYGRGSKPKSLGVGKSARSATRTRANRRAPPRSWR